MSIKVIEHGEMTNDSTIPSLSAEDISQYAKDYHAGRIFGSWQLSNSDSGLLPNVFMVLAFLDELTTKTLLNSGDIFCMEYYDKSANMNINGYPVFFSARFVRKADVQAILDKSKKIEELLKSI